jgi:hypothetical protein
VLEVEPGQGRRSSIVVATCQWYWPDERGVNMVEDVKITDNPMEHILSPTGNGIAVSQKADGIK